MDYITNRQSKKPQNKKAEELRYLKNKYFKGISHILGNVDCYLNAQGWMNS